MRWANFWSTIPRSFHATSSPKCVHSSTGSYSRREHSVSTLVADASLLSASCSGGNWAKYVQFVVFDAPLRTIRRCWVRKDCHLVWHCAADMLLNFLETSAQPSCLCCWLAERPAVPHKFWLDATAAINVKVFSFVHLYLRLGSVSDISLESMLELSRAMNGNNRLEWEDRCDVICE